MDLSERFGPSVAAGGDAQHLGITSALTQTLFPPSDSQAFQAVRDIRDALDEVHFQVKHDFLHKQASRSASKGNLCRSISSGNLLSSPRSRPLSPALDTREQVSRTRPVFDPVLENGFSEYYQTRRASNHLPSRIPRDAAYVAATLGFPQPNRSAVAAIGLAMQERPPSPSGLKQVLSQLQPVRPPVVVLQSRASAEWLPKPLRLPAAGTSCHSSGRTADDPAGSTAARVGSLYEQYNIRMQGCNVSTFGGSSACRGPVKQVLPLAVQQCSPWEGHRSPAQPGSPQNQRVLRSLALHTPHNIVAPGCLQSPAELTGAAVSGWPPEANVSLCSCPATQHRAASYSPVRSGSPLLGKFMYCSGCNQQHTLQQHQSCCHQCPSCCHCQSCSGQQQAPMQEASTASSGVCSCPCINAYKQGHRDAQKAKEGAKPPVDSAGCRLAASMPSAYEPEEAATVAAAAAATAAECREHAAVQTQQQVVIEAPSPAIEVQEEAGDGADAYTAPEAVDTSADDEDGVPQEDHLMGLLQQLIEMQQQLLQQNPPYEAQTLEDLSDQLAQMVAWSEPQHEEPLRQALALQQELLAIQQRELLASNSGAKTQAPVLQLPQQTQQQQLQLGLQEALTAGGGPSAVSAECDRTGMWVAEHQQGLNRFRVPSTAAATSKLLGDETAIPVDTYTTMSEEDELAAAAAAYEAVLVPAKPVAAAAYGYNQDSARTRQAGKVSWVDNPVAQQVPDDLLGLLDLHDDAADELYRPPGFEHQRSAESSNRSYIGQQDAASGFVAPEDSEAILAAVQAAYDDAFAAGGSAKPLVHFMMSTHSPAAAASSADAVETGGAVLHQGPPQVTAVAQVVNMHTGTARAGARPVPDTADGSNPAFHDDRSVADSAWSVIPPSRPRNQGQQANPQSAAGIQQQHFGLPATAAADVAGSVTQEQQPCKQLLAPTCVPSMVQHAGATAHSRAASDRGYIESQLSRLSSVRGSGSAASSAANTPHGNRATYSAAGGNSSQTAFNVATAAGLAALSDPGSLSSGASSSAAGASSPAEKMQGRGSKNSNLTGIRQQTDVGMENSVHPQFERLSVSFLETESPATVPEQQTLMEHSPVLHSSTGGSTVLSAAGQPHQQHAVQHSAKSCQQLSDGGQYIGEAQQAGGGEQQQQQHLSLQEMRRMPARAGSFEAPDSSLSSANHSARPSCSQVPTSMPVMMGEMIRVVPVQQQTVAAAAAKVSDKALVTDNPEAAQASNPSSPGHAQPAANSTRSTSRVASSARVYSTGSLVGSDSSRRQQMELGSMVSPMTSAPVSNRTSISNFGSVGAAAQQQQQHVLSQHSTVQRTSAHQQQLQSEMQRLSSRLSSRQSMSASTSGAATPATTSDWKQQQLLMQQQLMVQQQQLQQIKSIDSSAASTPRTSVTARNSTLVRSSLSLPGGPPAAAARCSASPAIPENPAASDTARLQQVPDCSRSDTPLAVHANIPTPDSIAKDRQVRAPQLVPAMQSQQQLAGIVSKGQLPAASNQPYLQKTSVVVSSQQPTLLHTPTPPGLTAAVDKTAIASDEQGENDGDTTSSDSSASDANASLLCEALLQRLVRKKKGRRMQQVLNCWWRYSVAHKAILAVSSSQLESAPLSQSAATASQPSIGTADPDPQQQQAPAFRVSLEGLKEGLQQYLPAGTTCADDVEFVLSGQVRLQRSPIKQRPSSVAKAASIAAERRKAAGLPARHSTARDRDGNRTALVADFSAAAIAAYAKPLQDALVEVQGMVDSMERTCITNSQTRASCNNLAKAVPLAAAMAVEASRSAIRPLGHSSLSTTAADIGVKRLKGKSPAKVSSNSPHTSPQRVQQLQCGPLVGLRSPDKHKLRGQLRHVQDRLVKLEVKMYQAQAMADDSCCSGAPNCSHSPQRHLRPLTAAAGGGCEGYCAGAQGLNNGCGNACKGGCVQRAGARRQMLVGKMQDEIGQLQQELAELCTLLHAAYA